MTRSLTQLTITILLFVIPNCLLAQANKPKIYAIVVGVSKYSDSNIPNLKFAEQDAKAFADFLSTPNAGSVPKENMALLLNTNATRKNVIRELNQLVSRSEPNDLFIFYFSGHGKNDVLENVGYLLTYDTESENEAGTAISMSEINERIQRSKAKMKVSYIDACHAGLFKSVNTKGNNVDNTEILNAYLTSLNNASEGHVAFLASSARQQSLEDEKLGHGVFTYYLLKGLKGEADNIEKGSAGYQNKIVTVAELQTYVTESIGKATGFKQKPTIDGNFDTEFPLSVTGKATLDAAIAGRPAKTGGKENPGTTAAPKTKDVKDEKLTASVTFTNPFCYGTYTFINKFSKPIKFTYTTSAAGGKSLDIVIAPGQSATAPRMAVGRASSKDECVDLSYDGKFRFELEEGGRKKYATLNLLIESGLNKYHIISPDNTAFK